MKIHKNSGLWMAVAAWLAIGPVYDLTMWAADVAAQAKDALAKNREALGGEAKVSSLKSLSAEGVYRRVMQDREMSGDLTITWLLPDKFQRTEQMEMPNGLPGPTMTTTLDGETGWMGATGPASMGHGMMIRVAPGGGGPGGPVAADPALVTRRVRAEAQRTMLGVAPSAALPALTFAYAGKADAADGEADALDVSGPDDLTARVFLDARTHLPVLLTFRGPDPRTTMRVMTMERPAGGHASEEEMRQRVEAERQRMAAGPPQLVEIQWFFADHRKVDGVMLPHRVTKSAAGAVTEEWEIKKWKVNPAVKAEVFKKHDVP